MKTNILLILFFLNFIGGFSQNSEEQTYLDSVYHVSQNGSTDSIRCVATFKLGKVYFYKHRDLANASKYVFEALEMAEQQNLVNIQAMCYETLSWMEDRKKEHFKALEYMLLAGEIYEKSDRKVDVFKADYNIGCMMSSAQRFEDAEIKLKSALQKAIEFDVQNWIFNSYMALGELYSEMENENLALENYLLSAKTIKAHHGTFGNGRIPSAIAKIYANQSNFSEANKWIDRAEKCVKRRNDKLLFKEFYHSKFKIKKMEGESEEALENYELYTAYQDSIFNLESLNASSQAEQKYLLDIKALEMEKTEAQQRLLETQKKQAEQRSQWMTLFIVVMIIILVITAYRIKVTLAKNKLIAFQKAEVDDKNKEILASITYAKRIQLAILPTQELIDKYLSNSFILYKPKDIVAGDFYWVHPTNNGILIAAADCTGHGVPGALVSVVCNNALNRAVREYNLYQPSDILDKTRELVVEEFAKSKNESVADGMDIALCRLINDGNNHKIEFAGAHNPLYIIKNNELVEIKANRQPIGIVDNPIPFEHHEISLEKEDIIYIFSDGFADQFGGENGQKKFNKRTFKNLLIEINSKPISEQHQLLNTQFEQWKGDTEQTDDVCVIGIRI